MPTTTTALVRERIIDACHRIMARYGFRKMTMDDLAEESGMSKRTIYLYFSSKAEVGLASISSVIDATHARLWEIARSEAPPEDQLRDVLMERIRGRIERVQEYSSGLDELFEAIRTPYMAMRAQFHSVELEIIIQILQRGVASGDFRCDSPEETAEILLKATNAFVPYSLSVEQLGQPAKILADLNVMVELLLRGLSAPNP